MNQNGGLGLGGSDLEKHKSPHSYNRFPFKSDSRELQYNKNKKELNHMENGPMKVHQDYLDAYRF